jgi:tRNA(fMet)-specific endonuclease VapC
MVVLDTDHISVLERHTQPGSTTLRAHLAHLPPDEVVTTIISYEEQMQGWMAHLAQSQSVAQQVVAYGRLLQHLDNYRRIPVLEFDEAAAVVFQRLRRARRRVGTMDLKIAAIVLSPRCAPAFQESYGLWPDTRFAGRGLDRMTV